MRIPALLLAATVWASPIPVAAQDWSSCASDLDSLRSRSSDGSSAAEEANSAKERVDSARDQLQQCVRYPQMYDLLRDGCRSKRSDYRAADDSYKSALSSLENALGDVDSKVRAVSMSCGVELRRVSGPPPVVPDGVQNKGACAVYLPYKGRLAPSALMATCAKQLGEAECKKCLGIP
jgi:hypothetical protein